MCFWQQKHVNPFKPSVLFVGYRQTVPNQIRRSKMWRLIRFSTVCLQNSVSFKIWIKMKIPTNTPNIGNGLVLLIEVGKSIRLKWVNLPSMQRVKLFWYWFLDAIHYESSSVLRVLKVLLIALSETCSVAQPEKTFGKHSKWGRQLFYWNWLTFENIILKLVQHQKFGLHVATPALTAKHLASKQNKTLRLVLSKRSTPAQQNKSTQTGLKTNSAKQITHTGLEQAQ